MAYLSGSFSRLYNWVNDRNAAINITASRMDAEMDGFATGLSSCLLKDGTQTVTANIPMATYKLTGLGAGSAAGDSVRYEQVVLLSAGANQTITRSAAGIVLTLESTEAGATSAPSLSLYRNSASPANNDLLGSVLFDGEDSGGTQTTFARIQADIATVTDTSEEGRLYFGVVTGGTLANKMRLDGTSLRPFGDDAIGLGASGVAFSDLFLASAAVVNFNAGNYTITHSAGDLLFSGSLSIGNADTTLARAAAGMISVEGTTIEPGANRASFLAHKNGSSQAVAATTETQVTFGTEASDTGSFFASNAWTPPSGKVVVGCNVYIENVGSGSIAVRIKRDTTTIAECIRAVPTASEPMTLSLVDTANGSNVYRVYVQTDSDTSYSVEGTSYRTFFWGTMA